jgi:hypothetical protein
MFKLIRYILLSVISGSLLLLVPYGTAYAPNRAGHILDELLPQENDLWEESIIQYGGVIVKSDWHSGYVCDSYKSYENYYFFVKNYGGRRSGIDVEGCWLLDIGTEVELHISKSMRVNCKDINMITDEITICQFERKWFGHDFWASEHTVEPRWPE